MSAPPLANTFESGQADGTTITTGNSGGGAGDAFNAITGTPKFSTTQAKNGSLAMKFDTTATYAQCHADWTGLGSITTDVWIRFYLYLTANPVSNPRLIGVRTSTPGNSAFLQVNTNGTLAAMNAAQSGTASGTVAVALNQWVRIEFRVRSSATVGQFQWWLYNNPDAPLGSHDDTNSASSMVLGANTDGIQWGPTTATGPANFAGWIDNIAVSSVAQIGPIVITDLIAPAAIVATSNITASVTKQSTAAAVRPKLFHNRAVMQKARRVRLARRQAQATFGQGVVGGSKQIAPAAITASSNVTAAVGRVRPVGASISASSAVTASVGRIRPIVAALTASSAITAALGRIRPIAASITASSTVTAAVGRIRRIVAAAINATSAVLATVGRVKPVTSAAITATSSVTASVATARAITASAAASSNVTASIAVRRAVAPAALTATSSVTASVVRLRRVSASITATSTVTLSQLRMTRAIGGAAINATSAIAGSVRAARAVAGTFTASSNITGSLARIRRLTGALLATSTVTVSVTRLRRVAPAAVVSSSAVTAGITAQPPGVLSVAPFDTPTVGGRSYAGQPAAKTFDQPRPRQVRT